MHTLLLSDDLMLTSQVTQVARHLNVPLKVVSNSQQLKSDCESGDVQQVILDLNSPQADPKSLVASIRATGSTARIIAIAPHVHVEKIKAARESGCDEVLTKGQFHATIQDWLVSEA